ncbi:XTP/dITP diphosphohydrolase [Microbacterium sp. SORGH_AS 505]|uniref:MazG family protein n=1 Tax=Microbacterium sp. SORGH_AS_0505 TaxID=3041770 RepID=UPI0027833FBD|nr:MazG family protein [Microbacterium sp. SORGH_AS_0505]MDQ1127758.1 XTP/dITP diphosphohydrolase [Microbacterium sp. SORGH_AS_0505]
MSQPLPSSSDALRRAAETMHAVRDRCVWTQRIDHDDLVPYLQEEAAELVDAVETGTRADLKEELGDLLWQVLFHAEIASRDDQDPFDIDDVADALAEKMIRRHPHVFGDAVATTPEEVLVHWNAAKAAEKRTRTSVLDGVSTHMPSLALAQKMLGKASQVGVTGSPAPADPADESELGDALLALVARARSEGWDAERALRQRLRALADEVRAAESS